MLKYNGFLFVEPLYFSILAWIETECTNLQYIVARQQLKPYSHSWYQQ